MKDILTINEAAKYFNIPKATLLYWEKEGLIHFERMSKNNYRKFTPDSIFQIELVLHLRTLGVPIETIKKAPQMSLEERRLMYENSIMQAREKIQSLQNIEQFAEKQVAQINEVSMLKLHPYGDEAPDFQYLVAHSTDAVKMESSDTGLFVLLIQDLNNWNDMEPETYMEASISETKESSSLVWELPKGPAVWKTFLLDIINNNGRRNFINLSQHLLTLQQMGYHPQSLVARYLCEECKENMIHIYFKAYVRM